MRSFSRTRNPAGVSRMDRAITSPEFMNRSWLGSGVYVASVASTGLAGAWALPLRVMNAKLTGSTPTVSRQAALSSAPAGLEL